MYKNSYSVKYIYSNYLPCKKTGQTRQEKPGKASKGKATYRSINRRRFESGILHRQAGGYTDKQTMRQTKRQSDKQTDRQKK